MMYQQRVLIVERFVIFPQSSARKDLRVAGTARAMHNLDWMIMSSPQSDLRLQNFHRLQRHMFSTDAHATLSCE